MALLYVSLAIAGFGVVLDSPVPAVIGFVVYALSSTNELTHANKRLTALEARLATRTRRSREAEGAPSSSTPAPVGDRPTVRTNADAPSVAQAAVPAATVMQATFRPEPRVRAAAAPPSSGPGTLERLLTAAARSLGPSGSSADAIEAWLSGRLLAIVGGAALLLGALFFLSLAFSRGWISEPIRIVIGLAAGWAMIGLAAWLLHRRFEALGHVLVAVGLSTISLALYAAASLYHLVPVEVALVGALAATLVAAWIAVRFDSQVVAAMGVVAVLVAPPIFGAAPSLQTVAYLGIALVGTTAISLFRSWRWLPAIAFGLSVPQLASFVLDDPEPVSGVALVLGYWALYAVAAGGEEWRVRRDELAPSSAGLLLASTTVALWAGFMVLDGPLEPWRPTFLLVLAGLHAVLAATFLRREGDRHLFGLLAAATAVAVFSIAPPLHFGAPAIPIAWSAEAAALAWVARARRHEYAALAAVILGGLAILYLVAFTYPPLTAGSSEAGAAFLGPDGATLAFVLLALAVAGAVAGDRAIRSALAAVGAGLVIFALPHELSMTPLVVALATIAAACLIVERVAVRPEQATIDPAIGAEHHDAAAGTGPTPASWLGQVWARRPARLAADALLALRLPALAAATLALAHLVVFEYPLWQIVDGLAGAPFTTAGPLAIVAMLVAGAFVAAVWPDVAARAGLLGSACLLLAYVLPFELSDIALVAAWVGLGLATMAAALLLGLPIRPARPLRGTQLVALPAFALAVTGTMAVLHALALDLSPARALSILRTQDPIPAVPFVDAGTAVAALLAIGVGGLWLLARWGGPAGKRGTAGRGATQPPAWVPLVALGSLAGYLAIFELPTWLAVDAIAALAVAAAFLAPRIAGSRTHLSVAAYSALGVGTAMTLLFVADPTRLTVDWVVVPSHLPLVSPATAAFGGLVVAIGLAVRWQGASRFASPALSIAGALVVYTLSVGLVDDFQGRIVGPIALEELQKQASVGLTVLWASCGGVVLGFGLRRDVALARFGGLGLLGLATAKAFVVDLAGLDVAYRVLSFVGLGILLLVSAYLAQRMRRSRSRGASERGRSAV